MKSNNKITKIALSSLIVAGLALNVSSCKKDGISSTPSTTVTEADAAELATDAVTPSTGGMVTQVNNSVIIYQNTALSCGVQKDSTLTGASASGVSPSYSYNLKWNYELNCSGIVPNTLNFNFTGSSTYDGPRMSSTDSSTGGFTLGGLSSTQYTLNTNYTRTGSTISKIGAQNSFNSTFSIVSSNIIIQKSTQQIVSGSATVSITATSTSGKSFTFNGTLSFLGGKKANLVLNSGTTYVIQWT